MPVEDHMPEARLLAAECWCDDETAEFTMNTALAEAFAKRIARLLEAAKTDAINVQFYRDQLNQCAENLGPLREKVFISDDGSIQNDPLILKVPELVAELARMAMPAQPSEPVKTTSFFSDLPTE